MASNRQYTKICEFCGKTFIAQKVNTRTCSHACASALYKRQAKDAAISADRARQKAQKRAGLKDQDFLSITDAATLLGISRPTLYKFIEQHGIEVNHIGARTLRIRRSDLEQYIKPQEQIAAPDKVKPISRAGLISKKEALETYDISEAYFYKKLKTARLPQTIIEGRHFYPKAKLDLIFKKNKYPDITEWYTVDQIMELFSLTRQSVYDYLVNHPMPRKRDGRISLISKSHWDAARANINKSNANIQ